MEEEWVIRSSVSFGEVAPALEGVVWEGLNKDETQTIYHRYVGYEGMKSYEEFIPVLQICHETMMVEPAIFAVQTKTRPSEKHFERAFENFANQLGEAFPFVPMSEICHEGERVLGAYEDFINSYNEGIKSFKAIRKMQEEGLLGEWVIS